MRSLVAAGTGWLSLGSSAEAAGGRLWISTDSAALYGCRCAWALRLMGTAFQDGDRYVDWLLTVSLLLIELLLVMKLPQQETVDLQRLALEQLAGVPPPDAAAIFWGVLVVVVVVVVVVVSLLWSHCYHRPYSGVPGLFG
ncbi:unnamed protein product [Polarella glacialis]|uniref:Uncharacterized protein n=1 Tax=Polarella glacialis TaxID=89957 RepID=A0A813IA43_POLGL|nr:unnamed protein product [Polarella glacialis]